MTQTRRFSRWVKWMTCCVISTPLTFTASPSARHEQDAPRIELGQTMERMIGGGEIHRYRISLNSGSYLRVAIAQQGIDIVVTILDPTGCKVARVDRPNGAYGLEAASVIAAATGDYRIEVGALQKFAARSSYVITATELRAATAEDSLRVAAERAVSEGEELRARESADTLSQAVEKFSQAI